MSATVTYTGKRGSYYVVDKGGRRWDFPRGAAIEVPDHVAALLPKKNKDLKVTKAGAAGTDQAAAAAGEERK